jgi:hypothetical protein
VVAKIRQLSRVRVEQLAFVRQLPRVAWGQSSTMGGCACSYGNRYWRWDDLSSHQPDLGLQRFAVPEAEVPEALELIGFTNVSRPIAYPGPLTALRPEGDRRSAVEGNPDQSGSKLILLSLTQLGHAEH